MKSQRWLAAFSQVHTQVRWTWKQMGPKCYISLSTLVNPPRHYLFCHGVSVELTHCAMTRVTSVAYSSSELNPKILKSSKIYPKLLSTDLFPGNNKDT